MELKSNIISSVFENGPMWKMALSSKFPAGSASPLSGIMFFGWIDQAPPDITVPGNRLTQQTTGLVYSYLDYQLPTSGYITLPAGMVPGAIVTFPINGGTCGPMGTTSVSMGRGEAEFEFQVPANLRDLQIDSLKLALWQDNGGQWGLPNISLYQWSDSSWINIKDPIQGTNVIQKAGTFINENGLIRVKVASENDTFGCIFIDMGLEATAGSGKEG